MQCIIKNIALTCLLLFSQLTYAQFFGGDNDGHQFGTSGVSTINQQGFYCFGGDNDGYTNESIHTSLNNQFFYCSGGNNDGSDIASFGPLVQFDQSNYCSGGNGDGFYIASSGSVIQIDQAFYCSGGLGDGYHMLTSGIIVQNDQTFYCSGGDGDGFSRLSVSNSLNEQILYCSGGNADGSTLLSSGVQTPNDASFYCTGGEGNGYDFESIASTINFQSFYCLGGLQDGYSAEELYTTINDQNLYCLGGHEEGYSFDYFSGSVFGINSFCIGGDGDGYQNNISTPQSLGIGIWTGITNTVWNTNTNWAHNTIPAYNTDVHIPAGCSYYPNITGSLGINNFGNTRCHGLMIESGASLNHSGYLFVKGEMHVEGNYINTFNTARSQIIFSNGLLHIPETGVVKMGNQISGTGLVDLIVNGGTLFVEGGTLEIDDQLHVGTGGTLNMTDGEVFIHKYGEGSTLSSNNPYNFWVKVGAMGELSGGTVYVTGRETDGFYGAVSINDPGFLFNGTNTLVFQNGDNPVHFDPAIYFPNGGSLQNLTINKPGNTVFVKSDLTVKGALNIENGSTLQIDSNHQLSTGQ